MQDRWMRGLTERLLRGARRLVGGRAAVAPAARRRAAPAGLEPLEPRRLLSVTVAEPLPDLVLERDGAAVEVALGETFAMNNTVVRFETVLGDIHLGLFDQTTPLTVQNFLDRIALGDFNNAQDGDTFFHRSEPGFVVQGGGFRAVNTDGGLSINPVPERDSVENEFDKLIEAFGEGEPINTRGTIAMAKLGGDPDSATSQWFFNVADNSENLDGQNGGFTTFGRVLGDGMSVVDALNNLLRVNAGGAFASLPVVDFDPEVDTELELENLARVESLEVVEDPALTGSELITSSVTVDRPELIDVQLTGGTLTVTPLAGARGEVSVSVSGQGFDGTEVSETFKVNINPPLTLDADGDGAANPFTDGLLIGRRLFGFGGEALSGGALGAGAGRTSGAGIEAFLGQGLGTLLDADGDGAVKPLTDGILIMRHLDGFTGEDLVAGATGENATRTTGAEVAAFLDLFLEQAPPVPEWGLAGGSDPGGETLDFAGRTRPGAEVTLLESGDVVTAGADGRFAFENVKASDSADGTWTARAGDGDGNATEAVLTLESESPGEPAALMAGEGGEGTDAPAAHSLLATGRFRAALAAWLATPGETDERPAVRDVGLDPAGANRAGAAEGFEVQR